MKEAKQLRELAAGHRAAGRTALADKLEADARSIDGKGGKRGKKAHKKEGGSVAKKKAKKAGKKAGKRAGNAKKGGKKGRKKARTAAQKAATKRMIAANKKGRKGNAKKPGKRKAAKKKPAKRAAAKKRTGNIKTGKKTAARKKAGKRGGKKSGRKKNPTKARSGPGAPPHPSAKKGASRRASKHITKAQREAAMGDTANVYMDMRNGRMKTAKQVSRSKNPSGTWWSVWWTFFGVVTGLVGTELLDRGVATMLTAKEIEEVEGDGATQMGAQGRDAFRRIMLKPGMARILSMFGAGGLFFVLSGVSGKKMPLLSDWLMGNGAAAWGLLLKKIVFAYVLPMLPGAVKDGPEVTWQNRIIPEYQDIPQAELEAYVAKVLPQIVDHTTNRMDGRERYDRMGLPWNMEIEHPDANAPDSTTIPSPGGAQAGLGAAGRASDPNTSKLMATRAGAQAAARDYEARFAAPSAVGDCCDGCRAGKTCEASCPKDGHGHDDDMTNTTIPPTVTADRSGNGSSNGGSAVPQPSFEATRPGAPPVRQLMPGGGSMPLAPTRDAAALLSRTQYAASQGQPSMIRGLGNLSAPPGHWHRRGRAA